jgi:prefoldin alpha subunit
MAAIASAAPAQEREINPMQLSLEQLQSLRTQNEEELAELSRQLEQLHGAKNRFINARNTLADMSKSAANDTILIPLNTSLYVPGKIVEPEKVIVELGTGYFCEKTVPAATELIDRKMQLVAKSIETVEQVGMNKRRNVERLTEVIQYRIQMIQDQRAAAGK